jgi:hypothetical protein
LPRSRRHRRDLLGRPRVLDSRTEPEEATATAEQVSVFKKATEREPAARARRVPARGVLFVVFLAGLHRRLRAADPSGALATAALAGGTAWAALAIHNAPTSFLAAQLPPVNASPDALVAIWGMDIAGVANGIALAVVLLAVGAAAFGAAALPRWLGGMALPDGIMLLSTRSTRSARPSRSPAGRSS